MAHQRPSPGNKGNKTNVDTANNPCHGGEDKDEDDDDDDNNDNDNKEDEDVDMDDRKTRIKR